MPRDTYEFQKRITTSGFYINMECHMVQNGSHYNQEAQPFTNNYIVISHFNLIQATTREENITFFVRVLQIIYVKYNLILTTLEQIKKLHV